MNLMNLDAIVKQCQEDSQRWFPRKANDLFFNAACVAGEAGELVNQMKKVERESHTLDQVRDKVVEEAVDVFIYLANVFALLGIDSQEIEIEYERKRNHNEQRFGTGGS